MDSDKPKTVEEVAAIALETLKEKVPEVVKAVEVVDDLVGDVSHSCSFFGWMFSARKLRHSPAKPAAPSNEESM